MGQIKESTWDSTFFGYKVGKLIVDGEKNIDWNKFDNFRVTYIFSQNELKKKSRDGILFLADHRVYLEKKLEKKSKTYNKENFVFFDEEKHSFNELLDLAYLAGKHSRFKCDTNFSQDEFKLLYRKWIEKSIASDSIEVILYTKLNKLYGFITLEFNDNNSCNIGLVAVSEKAQGQGLGSELIANACNLAFKSNCSKISVITQKNNNSALSLYKKNDFKIVNSNYIYHYWNL